MTGEKNDDGTAATPNRMPPAPSVAKVASVADAQESSYRPLYRLANIPRKCITPGCRREVAVGDQCEVCHTVCEIVSGILDELKQKQQPSRKERR